MSSSVCPWGTMCGWFKCDKNHNAPINQKAVKRYWDNKNNNVDNIMKRNLFLEEQNNYLLQQNNYLLQQNNDFIKQNFIILEQNKHLRNRIFELIKVNEYIENYKLF